MRHASHFSYRRRRSTSGHIMRAAASRLCKFLIISFFLYVCLKLTSLLVFFCVPFVLSLCTERACVPPLLNEWTEANACWPSAAVFSLLLQTTATREKNEKNECICPSIRNAVMGIEKGKKRKRAKERERKGSSHPV
jgi:hypothetical protein